MATITEMEPVEAQRATDEEDFPDEIQEKSEEMPKRGRPKNKKSIIEPEFWDTLAALGAQWDYTEVYVWRTGPEIDTTRGGKQPMYIKKYVGIPVDLDRIKQDCGSGGYKLRVNVKPPQGREINFNPFYCEIYELGFPPKVARGSWMDDSRNKKWAEIMPAEDEKPQANQQNNHHAAGPDGVQIANSILSNAQKIAGMSKQQEAPSPLEAVRTIAEVLRPQQQPARDVVAEVTAIAELLKPAAKSEDTGMMALLMQELKDARAEAAAARQQNHDLMMKMLDQAKQPAASPDSTLSTVKAVVEAIGLIRDVSGTGAAAGGVTGEIVSGVKDLITPWSGAFAPIAAQAVSFGMQQKHAQEMQKLHQSGAGNQPPPQQPQAAAVQPGQPAAAPVAQPNPQEDLSALPPGLIEVVKFFVRSLELGLAGDAAAEAFEKQYGSKFYDELIATPQEQAMAMLRGIPQVWNMLQPHEAKLPQFVSDFYDYALPDEPDEPEAPAPVAEAPKPARKGRKGAVVQ